RGRRRSRRGSAKDKPYGLVSTLGSWWSRGKSEEERERFVPMPLATRHSLLAPRLPSRRPFDAGEECVQRRAVVHATAGEHGGDAAGVVDVDERIAIEEHEIGQLAGRDRT